MHHDEQELVVDGDATLSALGLLSIEQLVEVEIVRVIEDIGRALGRCGDVGDAGHGCSIGKRAPRLDRQLADGNHGAAPVTQLVAGQRLVEIGGFAALQ